MTVLAYTDCGLKYDHNEDSYLINGKPFHDIKAEGADGADVFLVAVFDGVGGANAGEIASATAAEEMSGSLTAASSDEEIKDALLRANDAILKRADRQKSMQGMACTAAGLLLRENDIAVYNVGDSRVYKIKNGMMLQLTTDDSYENYLIREYGEQVKTSASSHTITSCLGTKKFQRDDVHMNILPAITTGERYFICSDGVTDYIDIDELEEILTGESSFEDMSNEIRARVYKNGAKDNFTFIILEK